MAAGTAPARCLGAYACEAKQSGECRSKQSFTHTVSSLSSKKVAFLPLDHSADVRKLKAAFDFC
jgi:hypothetical protein